MIYAMCCKDDSYRSTTNDQPEEIQRKNCRKQEKDVESERVRCRE